LSSKTNVALIGAGHWGKNLARTFHRLGVLKVVCDPSEEICRIIKEKYPDVAISNSFTHTVARPKIEAVVVATPAAMHYSMVKELLLAKKHVFVEKPLALTENEGRELNNLSVKMGGILFTEISCLVCGNYYKLENNEIQLVSSPLPESP